jgi:hypothetical protein
MFVRSVFEPSIFKYLGSTAKTFNVGADADFAGAPNG